MKTLAEIVDDLPLQPSQTSIDIVLNLIKVSNDTTQIENALHLCVVCHKHQFIKPLLDKLNYQGPYTLIRDVFIHAINHNLSDLISCLQKIQLSLSGKESYGISHLRYELFLYAIERGNINAVEIILKFKPSIIDINNNEHLCLPRAILHQKTCIVRYLLEQPNIKPDLEKMLKSAAIVDNPIINEIVLDFLKKADTNNIKTEFSNNRPRYTN